MYQLILIIHVLVAIVLIGLVLIQHGKGAEIGASFGSGASSTVFGSQGTGSFLFKVTGSLALVFFLTSLSLSYLVSVQYQSAEILSVPKPLPSVEDRFPIPQSKGTPENKAKIEVPKKASLPQEESKKPVNDSEKKQ